MTSSSRRATRKDEHIKYALQGRLPHADFSDIRLIHNCLPELDLNQVNLRTSLAGFSMQAPVFINAITGGSENSIGINRALARVAREGNYAMAVGSQKAALQGTGVARKSFTVVREENPQGMVWANLGAYADKDMAKEAVEMIDADGLQIHLNVPQELAMPETEGDRSFNGLLSRIEDICRALKVPVMVKEVGFGIAGEQARLLSENGVSAIDVGGQGGTNFLKVESRRSKGGISPYLVDGWGIPTAISLAEALCTVDGKIDVVASGGINNSLNMAKALAMGASAVGVAGMAVRVLCKYGEKALLRRLKDLEAELAKILLMTGSASLQELRNKPLVITGYTEEWLRQRGFKFNRGSEKV